jgi:hypothetical protein
VMVDTQHQQGDEQNSPGPSNLAPTRKRQKGRCHVCSRRKDKKTSTQCSLCRKHVCSEHSRSIASTICQLCSANS